MAEKQKRISVNALEKAACVSHEESVDVNWNGLIITVKKRLKLSELVSFVDSIVKTCFNVDTAEYAPQIKDFAIRNSIIRHYTNLSLPSDAEKRYEIISGCNVVEAIKDAVDQRQFEEAMIAVDAKINYLISEKVESITRQLNEVYAIIDGISDKFNALFDGVSEEELKNMMLAFSGEGINEKKIVEAVVDTMKE